MYSMWGTREGWAPQDPLPSPCSLQDQNQRQEGEAASFLRRGCGLSLLSHIPFGRKRAGFRGTEPKPPSLNVGVSKDVVPSLTHPL